MELVRAMQEKHRTPYANEIEKMEETNDEEL